MTEKERKLFEGFLSKTLKMDGEATSSLFNEEGELISVAPILNADAERMAKKKEEADKEYNKGTAKTMEKLERQLREQYGIDEDQEELKGVELINAIVAKNAENAKGNVGNIEIEAHPDFVKHRQEWEKKVRDAEKQYKADIEKQQALFQKEKAFQSVKEKAETKLLSLNPVLPEDPEKAKRMINKLFVAELEGYEYDVTDNGIIVKKDGKPVEDNHGNMISFEDLVSTTANQYFTFKQASERSSAGSSDSGEPKRKYSFKSRDDFNMAIKNAKDDNERDAMVTDYQAQLKS